MDKKELADVWYGSEQEQVSEIITIRTCYSRCLLECRRAAKPGSSNGSAAVGVHHSHERTQSGAIGCVVGARTLPRGDE